MPLVHSTMVPLGEPAPDFSLPGTDGNQWSLQSFKDARVLVVIFMCNHCPYVKATLARMIDIQNDYRDRGVRLVGINSNDVERYPDDSMENMKKVVQEQDVPFPYLLDESQDIARAYDAVCTPDIYVYGPERTLLYRGRIDDNWQEPGKATQHDLRRALDCILEAKDVFQEQIPSMGCSIKWKPNE